eukprot:6267517-Prymnesium_polylepis.1
MYALLAQVLGSVLPHGGIKKRSSTCRHKRVPTLYKITSPSGKSYVGQTVWPTTRMSRHKNGKSKCRYLAAAIKKYGWENMTVEILRGGLNSIGGALEESEMDGIEVKLIEELSTMYPNGYNIQPGGKVAWKGLDGLSRNDTIGPRPEDVKQKLRDVWEVKRENRLQSVDDETARRVRLDVAKTQATRQAKLDGTFTDGRFGPNPRRSDTWERKREAKLALMPPEIAEKERKRLQRYRNNANASYNRKTGRA